MHCLAQFPDLKKANGHNQKHVYSELERQMGAINSVRGLTRLASIWINQYYAVPKGLQR